jgi:hypothetical protein
MKGNGGEMGYNKGQIRVQEAPSNGDGRAHLVRANEGKMRGKLW